LTAAERTARDKVIAGMLAEGRKFKDVARALRIPMGTVCTAARRIGWESTARSYDVRLLKACALIDAGETDCAVSRSTRVSLKTVNDLRKELEELGT
jgi:DNA-binding NarL/FixJ family response regulator